MKRGYSRQYTPDRRASRRYMLDKIPAALWRRVRTKARQKGVSMRHLILSLLNRWEKVGR